VGVPTVEIGLSRVAVAKPGSVYAFRHHNEHNIIIRYLIIIISITGTRLHEQAGCSAVLARKIYAVCAYFRQRYCCSRHRKHRCCASSPQSYRSLLCVYWYRLLGTSSLDGYFIYFFFSAPNHCCTSALAVCFSPACPVNRKINSIKKIYILLVNNIYMCNKKTTRSSSY